MSAETASPNIESSVSEDAELVMRFAQQHYDLATRAYAAEQQLQGHLWGRFRDAVQLLTVVGTGHGAAVLFLADAKLHSWLVIPGVLLSLVALVFLACAARRLGRVFEGSDYSDQRPRETSRVLREYGSQWVPNALDMLATQLFKHAAKNYKINSLRSKQLTHARGYTLVSLYMLFPVWIAVFLAKLLRAASS